MLDCGLQYILKTGRQSLTPILGKSLIFLTSYAQSSSLTSLRLAFALILGFLEPPRGFLMALEVVCRVALVCFFCDYFCFICVDFYFYKFLSRNTKFFLCKSRPSPRPAGRFAVAFRPHIWGLGQPSLPLLSCKVA